MNTKAIILAGGNGSRLFPSTIVCNKQLLPIYDKPTIYYSLSTIMGMGIRKILIITNPQHIDQFRTLLSNGEQWNIEIEYASQPQPKGIAQALKIGQNWAENGRVCLLLGDNIFYGPDLNSKFFRARDTNTNCIFGYFVNNPEQYGVIKIDKWKTPHMIVEKPTSFVSNYAVPGIYFYHYNDINPILDTLEPSKRGEYEITDVNNELLKQGKLHVAFFNKQTVWLDTGTVDTFNNASEFVRIIQQRTSELIGSPEYCALSNRWISPTQFENIVNEMPDCSYKTYLTNMLTDISSVYG